MRLALVSGIIGQLLQLYSAAFLLPLLLSLWDRDFAGASHFAAAGMLGFALGRALSLGFARAPVFHRSEALAVVSFTWLALAAISALPYVLSGLSPIDALFESMSGLTTTGATVFTDFDGFSRSLFLWRAMTQWFGGLGVIALFIVVLPRLGIAGRQLFFAEASGAPSHAISPQVREAASRLWMVYGALTALLVPLLMFGGMSAYDAVLHALTTLSSGGFSPHGQSIAGYRNTTVEWILVPFMLLAGTSFTLQYRVLSGRPLAPLRDGEFRFYFAVCATGTLLIAMTLSGGVPDVDSLRAAAFQATSLLSSTGFASTDYNQWPDSARGLLILLMTIGGCAGSAAGGPKAVRLVLVFKRIGREITRVLHPRAVLPIRYGARPVDEDVMRAVFTLVVLYFAGYVVLGAALVALGANLVTGFTASLACLANIGPGLAAVGPMGHYADLPTVSKLLLVFAMWIGRLEIVTVLALLHHDVWRHLRVRA